MILESKNLSFGFATDNQIIRDISLSIRPGTFTAILGVNGSGKSTLLSCLDGMLKPQGGTILLDNENLSALSGRVRAQSVAYVTQHSHANAVMVYDALLLGRKPYLQGSPRAEDYAIVEEAIERFGLESLAMRHVDELSGGEYQKMVIARAFVQQPSVLLLDEPTNNLDIANQIAVLKIVSQAVYEDGLAAACVLHDVNLALTYCNEFVFMKGGGIFHCGNGQSITAELLSDVYDIECELIEWHGKRIMVTR